MSIKINGHIYCYKKSYEKLTIIEICQQLKQPCTKLCFLRHCNNLARCGLCLIKINNKLQLGCMTKIKDGDEVITQDPEIDQAVAGKLTDLLNRHNFNCGTCARINNCEFLKLIIKYKIKLDPKNKIANIPYLVNNSSCAITFDPSKCVGCNRCAAICQYNNGKSCIHLKPVSAQHPYLVVKQVEPDVGIDQSKCLLCGQCALACCTGAIIEKSEIDKVKTALLDKNKHVVVAIAPAVRVALGELFNMKPGINVIDQICTALKQIGFDDVYDLNFFADLTIFEEGFELLNRLGIDFSNHLQKLGLTSKNKNVINHHQLPLITSCCPG
jgi:NADH dehydrogenase/NADH:ubiquinone oxidoreductase subunit G